MSKGQYVQFQELPVTALFNCNGNVCKKVSTRTARLQEYDHTFYFGKRELCVVGEHSRLAPDYLAAESIA